MLKDSATAAGTSAYAKRFPTLPGNFRPMLGLAVGSIGIGTYLGEPDAATDAAYEEALKAALRGGINLIDTAVNYRFQRSERVIGKVLAELIASGEVMREEVVVATKGGYITFDGGVPSADATANGSLRWSVHARSGLNARRSAITRTIAKRRSAL